MAELTAADVAAFTGGRLADNATTQLLLDAALAAARRYAGWAVSPVTETTAVLDGPGGKMLPLPTMNLLEVESLDEDGVEWDVADLRCSRLGFVTKRSGGYWTSVPGSIEVTFTHGFYETDAADWRRAVLQLVDAMSYDAASTRTDPSLVRKRIDDVEYQWAEGLIAGDERLRSLFSQFRILPRP